MNRKLAFVVIVVALIIPGLSHAQIICPPPILKAIAVDGNPNEWSDVLGNCFQTTFDGNGYPSSICPTNDRDCGNINQGGRDLIRFAWTYDADYMYVFLERLEGATSQMRYLFYMDSNQNVYMDNGEKVFQILTLNSSASVDKYQSYNQAALRDNDKLESPTTGYADGWAIQGTVTDLTVPAPPSPGITPLAALFTQNFSDGTVVEGFEARFPWYLITPINPAYATYPFPLSFHISSLSGTQVPGSIQDNMGGPGGKTGTFAYSGVTVTPDNTGTSIPGVVKCYTHSVNNTSSFTDSYNLSAVSSQGYSVVVRNSCGGSAIGATPQINPGSSYAIAVEITIPGGASPGTVDVTTVTAASVLDPFHATSSARDTTAIGNLAITPASQSKTACLGGVYCTVDYAQTITNQLLTDTIDIRAISIQGWKVEYLDGATVFAVDNNGDGAFDSILAGYNNNANSQPDLQVTGSGGTRNFTIRLTPLSGTPGSTTDTLTITVSSTVNGTQATAVDTTALRLAVELLPAYITPNNLYGAKGFPVYFAHVLRNNTNTSAAFTLSASNPDSWPTQWWSDPDGDGNKTDGLTISTSSTIAGNGGTQALVLEVDIPSGTGLTTETTTASVSAAVGSATAQDDIKVAKVAAFINSSFSVQGTFFTNCSSMYGKGLSLVAGTMYRLLFVNPSSTVVQNHQLQANSNGDIFDSYALTSADATGTWKIQLWDSPGTTKLDEIPVVVERNGSVTGVSTGQVAYPMSGTPVSFSANFQNTNTVADFPNLTLEFSIQDQAGTQYMKSDGTFAAGTIDTYTETRFGLASGAGTSAASSVATPSFPSRGVYTLHARWKFDCGAAIPSDTTYDFLVGTVVNSYTDAAHTTGGETFNINNGEIIYLLGDIYKASTSYKYGVYDALNNLVASGTTTTDGSGNLTPQFNPSSMTMTGTYHIGIYPATATVPPTYTAVDLGRYASDSFNLTYRIQNLADSGSPNQASLTWNAVPDPTLQQYRIYRSATSGGPYSQIGTSGSASFNDTGLTNCTTYYYVVTFVNGQGQEQPYSGEITVTPSSGLAPANIGNSHHGDKAGGNAHYYWSAVSVDTGGNSVAIDYYKIKSGNLGNFVTITQTSTNPGVSWNDPRALNDGGNYWYKVTAVDKCGLEGN